MTTKVTNKVQSCKSEIASRTARGVDKDRGQGCPERCKPDIEAELLEVGQMTQEVVQELWSFG